MRIFWLNDGIHISGDDEEEREILAKWLKILQGTEFTDGFIASETGDFDYDDPALFRN